MGAILEKAGEQESWRELAHYFPSNECGKKYHEGIYLGI